MVYFLDLIPDLMVSGFLQELICSKEMRDNLMACCSPTTSISDLVLPVATPTCPSNSYEHTA